MSRRDLLSLAGAAGLTTTLTAGASGAWPPSGPGPGRARSCLIVFLAGGPSHIDTFDPKPDAPAEVRGPFRPIDTASPGVRICEHLPRLSRLSGRFALLRSLGHREARHDEAVRLVLTGRDGPEDAPEASLAPIHPARSTDAADGPRAVEFVALPDVVAPLGPDRGRPAAGPLGPGVEPILLRGNPNRDDFDPFAATPAPSAAMRRAVDLSAEPPRVRDRYGRDLFGQSLLLARRAVEAGARVVQANAVRFLDRGWDTHVDAAARLRDDLLPRLDRSLSALLEDMAASGLLDETLVVVVGEFGRAPRIDAAGGRDHWPSAFTALLAGAGVAGGSVVGATDRLGAVAVDRPTSPADLADTIRLALGVGRPSAADGLAEADRPRTTARPIRELWS